MFVDSACDDNYCLVAIMDCFLWESSNGTRYVNKVIFWDPELLHYDHPIVWIMESSILHSTAVVAAPFLKLCSA